MIEQQWHGELLGQARGLNGELQVMQDGQRRWLVFADGIAIQSCMLRNDPARLVLPYQQYMMMWPLFMSARPQRVALVGTGGGDIIRHLQHYYESISIQAIDEDPEVLRLACEYFSVQPGSGLELQVAEAGQFLSQQRQPQDVLLIDIIADDAMPACLYEASFWQACQRGLAAHGVLVVNTISSSEAKFVLLLEQLRTVFGYLPVCVAVPDHRNIVLFLTRHYDALPGLSEVQARATLLSNQIPLPVEDFLQTMQQDNRIENGRFKV